MTFDSSWSRFLVDLFLIQQPLLVRQGVLLLACRLVEQDALPQHTQRRGYNLHHNDEGELTQVAFWIERYVEHAKKKPRHLAQQPHRQPNDSGASLPSGMGAASLRRGLMKGLAPT